MGFSRDVVIVGGCGHVGLPLGIAFARAGLTVTLFDTNRRVVEQVQSAKMPFMEAGADEALEQVVAAGRLTASAEPEVVSQAEHVIVVVGTPVDDHLTPDPNAVPAAVDALLGDLCDGQHLVLRSTVFPGVTAVVERLVARSGVALDVSFCPERIAEGRGARRAQRAPPDRGGALGTSHRPGLGPVPEPHGIDRRPRDRGSRAGQAVHQHLALHQVRGRQSAVHDRQRPRPRLRADPRRAASSTTRAPPTCPGPASPPVHAC